MFDRVGVWALLVVSGWACGCGGKERVSLSAVAYDTELTVEERTLGTFLAGGFMLRVRLGPNAPRGTTATLESFSLVRASDQTELIGPLPLSNAPTSLDLRPGQEETLQLTLDATDPIGQGIRDEICAEAVQVRGSLTDTVSDDRSTPVQSDEGATVDGC